MSKRFLLASAVSATVFVVAAILVLTNAILEFDAQASARIAESLSSKHRFFVEDFTALGSEAILAAVVIGGLVGLISSRCTRDAVFFAVTVASARALNLTVKTVVGRERPHAVETVLQFSSYSFPSGHSAMSAAIYGSLLLILLHRLPSRSSQVQVSAFAVVVILLIGFSRVVLGVHFLTDVVGGWGSGLTCLFAAAAWWSLPQPPEKH